MNYQQGKDVMLSAAVTSETPTNWGLLRVKGDGSLSPLPLFDGAIVDVTCDESHHDGDTSHVRHHAQFIVRSEGVYVSDLDSGQGTWVDGIAVRKLGLAHGSVLRCGRCIALFVERDLAQSASPPKRKGNVVIGVRLQACLDTALGFIHGKRSFLVEGNAGVGKSTMVDAALRKAGETTPVCHLDGACFESEALVRAFERTSPCVWVVRHFEQFPRAAQADLVRTVRMMDGSFLIGTVVGSVEHAHAEGRVCSSCMTLMGSHVIRVPSLIERREDIPMLTMEYLRRTEVPMTFDVMGLFECVLRAGWTGGIRELQDHLSAAFSSDSVSEDPIKTLARSIPRPCSKEPLSLSSSDPDLARVRLQKALTMASGTVAEAARNLRISRQTFYRELRRLSVEATRS